MLKKIITLLIAFTLLADAGLFYSTAFSAPPVSLAAEQKAEKPTKKKSVKKPARKTKQKTEKKQAPKAQPPIKKEIKTISVETGNLFFKPKTLRLKLNEKVKVVIKNSGEHTFTIAELGVNTPLKGPNGEVTFTPNKKGTFDLVCDFPGHKEAGMVGQVIVE